MRAWSPGRGIHFIILSDNFIIVNYPALKSGAFHQRFSIMHSTTDNPIIWTEELVYSNSSTGKLGEKVDETLIEFPHQSRFDSDSQRGFSITIHNHTTPAAFIDSIVIRRVSFIKCTAPGTPLRSVISINRLKRNIISKAITFNKLSELSIGNSIYISICLSIHSIFSTTNTELFNSDRSIIFGSKVYNFFSNLSASGLNKVCLFMFKPSQVFLSLIRTFISMTSKLCNSSFILSLPARNIPAKIKLFNHSCSSGSINCYSSESGRANINTYNISFMSSNFWVVLFNTNSNLSIKKGNSFNVPASFKILFKSLITPINSDRNNKIFTRRIGDFKRRCSSVSHKVSEPSFIEPDRTSGKSLFDSFSFCPNIFTSFFNNIRGQKGGLSYV